MWENAYLSIKNPKASRALKQERDPNCKLLTLLTRLIFATSPTFGLITWGPPLTKSWIRTSDNNSTPFFLEDISHFYGPLIHLFWTFGDTQTELHRLDPLLRFPLLPCTRIGSHILLETQERCALGESKCKIQSKFLHVEFCIGFI